MKHRAVLVLTLFVCACGAEQIVTTTPIVSQPECYSADAGPDGSGQVDSAATKPLAPHGGDSCHAETAPDAVCGVIDLPDGTKAQASLVCRNGWFVPLSYCRGPDGCSQPVASTLPLCDTRVAKTDEPCDTNTMQWKQRSCSVDGATLLRCDDGHWAIASTCRGPEGCRFTTTVRSVSERMNVRGAPRRSVLGTEITRTGDRARRQGIQARLS
jgi:hypothetical protein